MSTFNLNFPVIFFLISPVCRPWQVPPGAARTPRTPLATPLAYQLSKFSSGLTFSLLFCRAQILIN